MPLPSPALPTSHFPGPTRHAWALRQTDLARDGHEYATLDALSRRLALLLGHQYQGVRDAEADAVPRPSAYFVPERTLTASEARALGVASAGDLFGGVVPCAFLATKVISHPVLDDARALPAGWSAALAERIGEAVLPGFTVFTGDDARRAQRRLRGRGPLRLKLAHGIGGRGQFIVDDADQLEAALSGLPAGELEAYGAVLELHLYEPRTWSVGWAECGSARIAYVGEQRLVRNRLGEDVYGGSDLVVARDGFDVLPRGCLQGGLRRGLEQARSYHRAVAACFPGFFASRCNYDVIEGRDQAGARHVGVLEQSWRIGGASPAEIAAMRALADDPALDLVHASSHEVHGPCAPPAEADVHYHGVDPGWGEMTKYSTVVRHGH